MVGSDLRNLVMAVILCNSVESQQDMPRLWIFLPIHCKKPQPLEKLFRGPLEGKVLLVSTEVLAFCRDLPSAAAPSWGEIEEPRRRRTDNKKGK